MGLGDQIVFRYRLFGHLEVLDPLGSIPVGDLDPRFFAELQPFQGFGQEFIAGQELDQGRDPAYPVIHLRGLRLPMGR